MALTDAERSVCTATEHEHRRLVALVTGTVNPTWRRA